MAANSLRKRPAPGVICTTPRPASRRASTMRNTSPVSARRLGTGLPPAPAWVGDLDVGGLPLDGVVAEHVEAERRVADHGANIEAGRGGVEPVQVLGEGLEG